MKINYRIIKNRISNLAYLIYSNPGIIVVMAIVTLINCILLTSGYCYDYVPGEMIIKFKSLDLPGSLNSKVSGSFVTFGKKNLDELQERFDVKIIQPVFQKGVLDLEQLPEELRRIYKIRFDPSRDMAAVMKAYVECPEIEMVEPNYISSISYIPNDPQFSSQWSHANIRSSACWDVQKGNDDTIIAIIDTGIDYTHEDLSYNTLPGYDFVDIDMSYWQRFSTLYPGEEDYTIVDNDPMDVVGHGTHCAGIASADTDNSTGIAGVAFNCKILPVRAGFKADSSAYLDSTAIANALYYAADHGADVISMSFGGSDSTLQRTAIEYAYSKGCVLVAASGNENMNCDNVYPAAYSQVISVGATSSNNIRASFSNYGSTLDVVAPGVNILSTLPGNSYGQYSGTSMATPHVAGLAALIHIAYPDYTNADVLQAIRSGSDDLGQAGFDVYYGYGRINLENSLQITRISNKYLYVTYNDLGIWKLDTVYGYGIQPIEGTLHNHVYNTASGDLNGDSIDELYVNFGNPDGIWMKDLMTDENFIFCDIPPEIFVNYMFCGDTNGDSRDELYIDFGLAGIFCYQRIGGLSTEPLPFTEGYVSRFGFAADTDGNGTDELYFDYGTDGIWCYEPGKGWALRELPGTSGYMAVWGTAGDSDCDSKDELYFDYGSLGIWRLKDGAWFRLSGTAGYESRWGLIIDGDNNGIPEFYIEYGIDGIWKYTFSIGWSASAVPMTAGDISDFGVACYE